MTVYEKSIEVMNELFAKDVTFSLTTSKDGIPSVRVVDIFAFWIVTDKKCNKATEIENNPDVALCRQLYRFSGKAYIAGHPCNEKNRHIRKKLIKAFESWYFAHNNENNKDMCYIRVDLQTGFFYHKGIGYSVNFAEKIADEFPFEDYIINE